MGILIMAVILVLTSLFLKHKVRNTKHNKTLLNLFVMYSLATIFVVSMFSIRAWIVKDSEILELQTEKTSILNRVEHHDPFDWSIATDIETFNNKIHRGRKYAKNWFFGICVSDAPLYVDPITTAEIFGIVGTEDD